MQNTPWKESPMPWSKNMMVVAMLSATAGVGAALLVPAMLTAKQPFETAAAQGNLLKIDGDQSELRLAGKDAGLHADKDGVRLRTSAGNFDLRW
jgi:hypothetical protein